jgi:hypothetical protein
MRHTPAMAELAQRLRRWHLLLPAGYRPPLWPRIAMLAGAGCGVAALAWSVTAGRPSGSVAGAVIGGVAAAAGAGGWWLSGRHPRIPVTDAGHDVLTGMYTHYRRGGMPDMAGHGVALRGAAAVRDPELRDQLGALEAAGTRGWAWRPAERPDETVAETTPPARSSRFPTGYSGLRGAAVQRGRGAAVPRCRGGRRQLSRSATSAMAGSMARSRTFPKPITSAAGAAAPGLPR